MVPGLPAGGGLRAGHAGARLGDDGPVVVAEAAQQGNVKCCYNGERQRGQRLMVIARFIAGFRAERGRARASSAGTSQASIGSGTWPWL
jgi:hypothetical protein